MQTDIRGALSSFLVIANSALAALPSPLAGVWEELGGDERGAMTILITKEDGVHVEGIVSLTGSKDCVKPIPFRGTIALKRFTAIADAPKICGGNGKLTAEIVKVNSGQSTATEKYTGTFAYEWFGIIWKEGTFQLDPPNRAQQ